MDMPIHYYQYLPYYLNPVAFSWKNFSVDWYSLMYFVGFAVVYLLLRYRITKGENLAKTQNYQTLNAANLLDLLMYIFFGLLVGARLGYALIYDFSYYFSNPLAIVSPFDPVTHEFVGIYGMSYHGGLIGAVASAWIFAKIRRINFRLLSDFVIPAVPAGYFFGRLGNFLNGELYGRVTDKFWGMYFPADMQGLLRHPSTLYEAALEGLILFFVLWRLRNQEKFRGRLLGLYISLYALFRILAEFFREPDQQIGYIFSFLTLGQGLSFIMLIFGLFLLHSRKTKKVI